MKICFYVTADWYFCSHRLPVAKAAKAAGHEVVVITRVDRHGEAIRRLGLELIHFDNSRGGINPITELWTIVRLTRIYRKLHPDLVHHVAVKPVLYGSVAAFMMRVPRVVNALAGLGWLFSSRSRRARFLRSVIRPVLGFLLRRGKVIVQNDDDEAVVRSLRVSDVHLIRGSGVDVERFAPGAEPDGIPVVMLVARLLREKGVEEFAEAARLLAARDIAARFVLVGAPDPENRSSVPSSLIDKWVSEGIVEWWGQRDDMPEVLSHAHIACLPSYYGEGVPKSLLEAAACGLPIVTTDMPGCRDVVRDGYNGLLVPIRDAHSLAAALERLLRDEALRKRMGAQSREIALAQFSDVRVAEATMNVYCEFDMFSADAKESYAKRL